MREIPHLMAKNHHTTRQRENAIALQQSIKLLRMDNDHSGAKYKIKVENLPPSKWTKHGRQKHLREGLLHADFALKQAKTSNAFGRRNSRSYVKKH